MASFVGRWKPVSKINYLFLKLFWLEFYERKGKQAVTGVNSRNERCGCDGPDIVTFMLWLFCGGGCRILTCVTGRFLSVQSLISYCCRSMQNKKAENKAEDGGQTSKVSEKAWEFLKDSIRATHLVF